MHTILITHNITKIKIEAKVILNPAIYLICLFLKFHEIFNSKRSRLSLVYYRISNAAWFLIQCENNVHQWRSKSVSIFRWIEFRKKTLFYIKYITDSRLAMMHRFPSFGKNNFEWLLLLKEHVRDCNLLPFFRAK